MDISIGKDARMFFVLALIAMLAYAYHNVLMATYYRRIDLLWAVTLRGVGLSLTMLPLLLVPSREEIGAIAGVVHLLVPAALSALVGNWAGASAVRYLPIGVANALNMSIAVLASVGFSYALLDERLAAGQLLWMALIVLTLLGLGAAGAGGGKTYAYSIPKGVLSSVLFGVCLGLGFTLMGRISRAVHPLVAGYCWEASITVCGLTAVAGGTALQVVRLRHVTARDVGRIVVYAIPAAVGTACYALAVARGPVAIVAAVLATMMVATALLARLVHGERLTRVQWILILLVCGLVLGLKFSGP